MSGPMPGAEAPVPPPLPPPAPTRRPAAGAQPVSTTPTACAHPTAACPQGGGGAGHAGRPDGRAGGGADPDVRGRAPGARQAPGCLRPALGAPLGAGCWALSAVGLGQGHAALSTLHCRQEQQAVRTGFAPAVRCVWAAGRIGAPSPTQHQRSVPPSSPLLQEGDGRLHDVFLYSRAHLRPDAQLPPPEALPPCPLDCEPLHWGPACDDRLPACCHCVGLAAWGLFYRCSTAACCHWPHHPRLLLAAHPHSERAGRDPSAAAPAGCCGVAAAARAARLLPPVPGALADRGGAP